MQYTRKIKVEYYKVVCKTKEDGAHCPDRDFDLALWIEKAERLSLEARTFDYVQEQARLDRFWYDRSSGRYFMCFVRLRDTNLPTKAKINRESEPLNLEDDEYLGEEACALYDRRLGVLALQRNRNSLSVSGIEHYINLLWNSDDVKIYLRPIAAYDTANRLLNAYEYRRVTIRFADINKRELPDNQKKTIFRIFNELKRYNAVNAEITITMGYNRNESLSKETVRDTIETVLENDGLIAKAEVGIRKSDDTEVELLDLFDSKVHNFIFVTIPRRESLASEYVSTEMNNKFDEMVNVISASLERR